MTVKLLVKYRYGGIDYAVGNLLTADAGTESGLIAAKLADSNLTGGTTYTAPASVETVDETHIPAFALDSSGNVTGLVGPGGRPALTCGLIPNGLDQADEIEQYFNDTGKHYLTDFGPGTFIIGRTLNIQAKDKRQTRHNGAGGLGLNIKGSGIGATQLRYVGPSGTPAILISPVNGISQMTEMVNISDFSLVCANTNGTDQTVGTTRGSGIECRRQNTTETVFGLSRFERIQVDGFDYGISLDDATFTEIVQCQFPDALSCIRIGYNVDLLRVRQTDFSYQGAGNKNTMVGISDGWNPMNDGFFLPGSGDCIIFDQCIFNHIGLGFAHNVLEGNILFLGCYYEATLQYYLAAGAFAPNVTFQECHFSLMSTNDSALAKIDMSSTSLVSPFVRVVKCTGSPAATGPFIKFGTVAKINWSQNNISSSAGHLASSVVNYVATRVLPDGGSGNYVFGYFDSASPLAKVQGDPITVSTNTPAASVTLDTLTGDRFILKNLVASQTTTVSMALYQPSGHRQGQRITITFTTAASVTGVVIAFDTARFKLTSTITQPTVAFTTSQFEFEFVDVTNNRWIQVSPPNAWV